MKSHKVLPTIANVAAGNTVSITLPTGNTYESIKLYYAGVTPEQLKNIRLELNGRMISEFVDGKRLVSIDKHYDRKQTISALTFYFNRTELKELAEQRFYGLDTSASQGIQTAVIKIDIDAAAAEPVLEATARTTQSIQGVPNYLTKVRRFFVQVGAAGQFDIDNIPRPAGASIAAIHLYMPDTDDADSVCQITSAELLIDNVSWNGISAARSADEQKSSGRVPQVADSTVIDMILDGDTREALPLTQNIQDFRLRCTAASAGQVEVMIEYLDLWGQGRF